MVAGGEHFALLGHADLRVVAAGRLGEDRLGRRAAAARDAAAAAVEKREAEPALLADVGDRFLRLEQRPVRGEVAAILVAVGVAEHDLLVIAARLEMRAVGLVIEHLVEDAGRGLEIAERLEERRDVERHADEMLEDHAPR